jgi:DNA-binding GntR family transcriptional regulator
MSRTTQANVTEYLRSAILSGELPPGTRLVQADLAEVLSVSVTPIREALRELNTEGLIDLDAFRGAVVHTPTLSELEDIYEVRAALLPLNTRKGIQRIHPQDLEQASALLDQMEAETDRTQWVQLNRQFHELLYRASSNTRSTEILQRLSDIAAVYINLALADKSFHRDTSNREHRLILDAYRSQDADRAISIMLSHINTTLEIARTVLRHSP